MPLTRPPLSFLNSNSTVFTDPLLVLHQGSGSADSDVGFVFNRANGLVANVALYWSEADSTFYTTFTNSGGATDANLAPTTYANLVTNVLSANTVSVPSFTTTGNITGGNLITTGTVTLDRLSLSSSQTTVPPLQLTASSLQDGVGALRIDGSQADIFLNPATATHTTVTFAVNNDQRLAFGMDNSSDFYITRRTGGSWYDDTLVIDRDSGQVALGYNLLVSGDATVSGNLTVNGTTTTVSSTNTLVSDSLMELNSGAGSNANDLGFIFERGSTGDNAAIIWDESADVFVLGTTTATGASTGDLTVSQVGLHAGSITINSAYTFPTADGSANQVLQTDGSGALSFASLTADTTLLEANIGSFQTYANTTLSSKAPTASPTFTGNATFDTNTLFVDSTNNRVGIGTTSTLGAKLFVAQGAAASPSTSGNMTTGTVVGSGTAGEALNVGTDADGVWYNAAYGNNAGVARIHRWLTGGTERMRIDEVGNVGIGNASPASSLTVAGVIESTTGGVKFPDGTTQTSAASAGITEATAIEYAIALG